MKGLMRDGGDQKTESSLITAGRFGSLAKGFMRDGEPKNGVVLEMGPELGRRGVFFFSF